jgi:ubiquinone/menaquinone biosynthesis C-methylase UbiE
MRLRQLYDVLAPVYSRIVPGLFELVTSRAVERLTAGAPASVIEVGVGPGQFLNQLTGRSKAKVFGVDLSRAMLTRAKDNTHGVHLAQADALALPFRNGTFESAVAVFLLDVLPGDDTKNALLELARVLAPGGRLVIGSLQFTNALVRRAWMLAYQVAPDVVGQARPVRIDRFLDEVGLRVLKDEEVPNAVGARVLTLVKAVG